MELNQRIKDYWEGEADSYSNFIQKEVNAFGNKAWKDLILENAPRGTNLEILDIGTGPGFFPIILSGERRNVTGIDLTESMISCAKENVRKAGKSAKLLKMNCQDMLFDDNSFDLVISRNLTWTLSDPTTAYKEWFRVLKPGGRLLIFDSCWYLHYYDETSNEEFLKKEKELWDQCKIKTFEHANSEEDTSMMKKLFMSDKHRPLYDVGMMIKLGFSKIFTTLDVTERIYGKERNEFNKQTFPIFMVGGEK